MQDMQVLEKAMIFLGFTARVFRNSIHLVALFSIPVDLLPASVMFEVHYCLN